MDRKRGRWIFRRRFFVLWGVTAFSIAVLPAFAMLEPLRPRSDLLKVEQLVRVRLDERAFGAKVRGYDLEFYENRGSGLMTVARVDRQSEWRLDCASGQVIARSSDGTRRFTALGALEVRTPAGFFRYQNRPYRERLAVYPREDGTGCEIVNTVSIEKYLDGLVNAEFSSRWSPEAVAAQVVAARTYALYRIDEAKRDTKAHYDVDATDRDQVYDGSIREDYQAARSVESTRGLVLMVDGATRPTPLKAFYHSTCGGTTTLPDRVWNAPVEGFKRRVRCTFCRRSPAFQWKADVPHGVVEAGLRELLPAPLRDGSRLGTLQVTARDDTGRVDRLLATWKRGSRWFTQVVSGAQFRSSLGAKRLRSTQFELAARADGWTIAGRGNGHGVGLCQWGAKVMGERGYAMASILKHYYPDAVLKKLW